MQTRANSSNAIKRPRTGSIRPFLRSTPDLSWRILNLLNGYRILVAVFLFALSQLGTEPRAVGANHPVLFLAVDAALLLAGIVNGFALSRRWPNLATQVIVQLSVDIVAILLLMHASGGIRSGLGSLLIISLGAGSLMLSRRTATLMAAIAALGILAEQTLGNLSGVTTAADYIPAGMLGGILFVIALSTNPIARRIRETEALAEQRGIDLANLAALNEYIIQNLRESIVVVDHEDRIRLINESAARHLGVPPGSRGIRLGEASPRLLELVHAWRSQHSPIIAANTSFVAADNSTLINTHFAPMGPMAQDALLIFLEDASLLAERVQQSKLAALGRLSASIAHEIRNPVGAMSHAGQLLAESPNLNEDEKRLTEIIHGNSGRVSTIIENVLQLSRRDSTRPERLLLNDWLQQFVKEFATTMQLDHDWANLRLGPSPLEVRMDPSHLEQALWNLCDNALTYGRSDGEEAEIVIRCGRMPKGDRPYMEVVDRGPGIDGTALDRIFEPFFTSRGDGTGLGLFIARELCECNRATLLYERGPGGGSIFRIVFADPKRWES